MDEGKQVVMAAQEEGSHFYDHKNLPLGYRFVPTDKDLLYYLNLKILNKPVPTDAIIDVELYKYHPHDLCRKFNRFLMFLDGSFYILLPIRTSFVGIYNMITRNS